MISGAPASGKGTQCELIVHKVTHSTAPYPFLVLESLVILFIFQKNTNDNIA